MAKQAGSLAPILLLLAFVWQAFVLQTHFHAGIAAGPDTEVAATPSVAAVGAHKSAPATPACPLCEEQALFGAYVYTAPLTLAAPHAVIAWYEPATHFYSIDRQPAHHWQSRAPPPLLDLSKA